ncbi:PREDICTED: thiol protease SEN102-like [Priapulus caudatus]|uniref:Thiol protease SEN102-like n=1 Tax=Priapulus caudatus TaxID=37621 RepID=A0ABM1DTT9_PRICU|nr:PREDICTED: thiol protease SEN102-like [Priapulus caudatus]
MNMFGDMTFEEFLSSHGGASVDPKKRERGWKDRPVTRRWRRQTPTSFPITYVPVGLYPNSNEFKDWTRTHGTNPYGQPESCISSRVHDQGKCNSTWAHATVETLAAVWCIKFGQSWRLSAQQLIDCDYGNYGCSQGGDPYYALEYIHFEGISESRFYADHPDTISQALPKQCVRDVPRTPVKVDEAGLESKEANLYSLLQTGPVIVGLNVEPLQFYKEGIIR